MKRSIATYTRWTLKAFGTIALLFLMPWLFLAGNLVARVDLARGHTEMLESGPPATWSLCAATVLQGVNDVDLLPIALCGISSAESQFEHGYNAAMHGAMHDRVAREGSDDRAHRAALDARREHMLPRQ